jgi:hypothetical protein
MNTYEIIGKLPLFKKKFGFYRNELNSDKLAFGLYYKRINGLKVSLRRTASSKEEAWEIAQVMLLSKEGFQSVVIQEPQKPENGATELSIKKNSNPK